MEERNVWSDSYGELWGVGDHTIFMDGHSNREHLALYRISSGTGNLDDHLVLFYGRELREYMNTPSPILSRLE